MSGATEPVVPGTLSLRSTTTSSDTERQEQAIIAQLLEHTEDARRETYPVRVLLKKKKVVSYGGPKILAVPTSPSSLGQLRGTEALTKADMLRLGTSDARLLIAHVNTGAMRPAQLAFAAEVLGATSDRAAAEQTIRSLLTHPSSIVREGAVYGLAEIGSATSRDLLRRIAEQDPSPGVREAATESLDD